MKNPLKLVSRRAPKMPAMAIPALPTVPPRTRRIAALSTACAVVVGVGAGSAMFVDYLADRAMARAADAAPEKVVREIRIASNDSVASDASADSDRQAPAVRPPEIVAKIPVIAAPEHAIETPLSDPTAEPLLQLDQVETAALDATDVRSDGMIIDDAPAGTAIDEGAQDDVTAAIPRPQVKKTESSSLPPEPAETELAALPGVDVGGLAGHPSESSASTAAPRPARILKSVNMRARGQKGAKVLTVIPAGATIDMFGCDSWCEISYKGRKGWVYKSFVGKARAPKKPESQASAAAPDKARGVKSIRDHER